jgi:hypothetical protein
MVAEGATDAAIAARLGGGLHRMAVSRHRRNHVEAPARAIVAAAAKGRDVVEQRAQTLAAAEAGDPAAFVALGAIVNDLRQVHDRLERTATAAEYDNQRLAVASLAGQQLRAAEVRAKLGGVGAYAPPKVQGAAGSAAMFNLVIKFSDHAETIGTALHHSADPAIIDADADDPDTDTDTDAAPALFSITGPTEPVAAQHAPDDSADAQMFSLTIKYSDHAETIGMTPLRPDDIAVIDADTDPDGPGVEAACFGRPSTVGTIAPDDAAASPRAAPAGFAAALRSMATRRPTA